MSRDDDVPVPMFEDMVVWGLPLANEDAYTYHCLERSGAEDSFAIFPRGVSPFSEDKEMSAAAVTALTTLRGGTGLTGRRFSLLCWLEECLLESIRNRLYDIPYDLEQVRKHLGQLSNLVNQQQVLVAYTINARAKISAQDIDEAVAKMSPADKADALAMRDKLLPGILARLNVQTTFGESLAEAETLRKKRLRDQQLTYLRNIL